jgi:hypothetical protein
MASKAFELIPSARRMITSLRDMGYDFATAVADVIDNSIEAKASRIAIDVNFDGDDSSVRIADNGHGMTPAQIREALRYGAEREYDSKDALGKFGLGLKTASMSQCQRLTLASRSSDSRSDIYAQAWDLEHVMATDRWEIVEVAKAQQPEALRKPLMEGPGTVVFWQRLDRILGYKHPYGEMAKKRLSSMCRELEEHLGMVFHRYMAGEAGGRKIRITLNGNPVKLWDPFSRVEPKTQELEPITLTYDHDAVTGKVVISPYVLPHQDDYSSQQAHVDAGGPLRWNRQQGFYIYRANRMIQSGGWSNLRTLDEHTKLARVAVSFSPELDEAFRINVAKMKVQLPQLLREQFEKAIGPVIKIAQTAYRRPERTVPGAGPSRIAARANLDLAVSSLAKDVRGQASSVSGNGAAGVEQNIARSAQDKLARPRLYTVAELRSAAERVATRKERPVVTAVFERLNQELADE